MPRFHLKAPAITAISPRTVLTERGISLDLDTQTVHVTLCNVCIV